MRSIWSFFLLLVCIMLATYLSWYMFDHPIPDENSKQTVEQVAETSNPYKTPTTRILMHSRNDFTFFVPKVESAELDMIRLHSCLVRIFEDVTLEEHSWFNYTPNTSETGQMCNSSLEIHIHSASEIDGAGDSRVINP